MSWIIRAAAAADAETLADFNCRLAHETEDFELDSATVLKGVRAGLADPHKARYFVALDPQGGIVGQLMLTREWSDWRNGFLWWIQSVYVREEARQQGVFAALYRHVEDAARADAEAIGIRLYVEQDNARAQRTYERCGMAATPYRVYERYPL